MKRFLAVGALLIAMASAVFVARADAILFGTPDKNDNKGVGYIVFYDAGNVPLWRCTGALVSRTAVLTAGHCAGTFDDSRGVHTPARAQVWFDKQIGREHGYPGGGVSCDGYKGWPCTGGDAQGLPVPHPLYEGSRAGGVINDIGVVRLFKKEKRKDVLYLAPVGTLDRTAPDSPMTIIGFGTQSPTPPPADQRQRMRGEVTFLRVEGHPSPDYPYDDPAYADFTNRRPGAVACLGDSGGPVLDQGGHIVAVMSLIDPVVDGYCEGDAYHYRTDTADTQAFLATFGVQVPGAGDAHDHGKHGKHHKHGKNLTAGF